MAKKPFRILNLSDLHFGECSYWAADLGRPLDPPLECARNLLDRIQSGLATANFLKGGVAFDAVVLSGDFTCKCDPRGFMIARHFIEQLTHKRGWAAMSSVLLIPGNHDMFHGPRTETKLGLDEWPTQWAVPRLEERQKEYLKFTEDLQKAPVSAHARQCFGGVTLFPAEKIALLGIDSCRIESGNQPGIGYAGMDQVSSLIKLIEERERDGAPWRKLVFLHHHPEQVGEPPLANILLHRISYLVDGERLLNWLRFFYVDFVVHGHCHAPRVRASQNAVRQYGRILSVGSAGVRREECEKQTHHFFVYELMPETLRVIEFACSDGTGFEAKGPSPEFPLDPPRVTPADDEKSKAGWAEVCEEASWRIALMNEWPFVLEFFCQDPDRRRQSWRYFEWELRDAVEASWGIQVDHARFRGIFTSLAIDLLTDKKRALFAFKKILDGDDRVQFTMFLYGQLMRRYPTCRELFDRPVS
ncbi:MAG TPA: metallophosphoesterase [Bryobacteraceae bacterium]|jgi:UDP-2,3-diacylglucosamine pyrophosphatase LpxH